ncbi:DeoR/GlpR family DNA-binding transcription regulator [Candidatus Formimonas warabiya]|uniref:Transcriptional regulator n=1 Tax=Formimonas warabiya TaxID=1761012 RepID=A0A3G1KRW9_FORW1|nr:DeoR/GlpR family DNA-binding transcription regulator [Candidatus Formimonas warabiya]ATW24875.1 transcriptional regulator [Candidatus Formimonas warabiya]
MYQIERHERMLEYINEHKKATVDELSQYFGTSKVTIRSDINELAKQGLVIKTHGGVLSIADRLNFEIPYHSKFRLNIDAKAKIGTLAATMIKDNDVIILDAGSTTFEIIKKIKSKNITVITNDVKIGFEAARMSNINLIMTGGELEKSVYTLIGTDTEEFLRKIKVNKVFLGCDALDVDFGLSNTIIREVGVKKLMIAAANHVILVTDSSKFNKRVFVKICDLDCIHSLITDQIDHNTREALEAKGIAIYITG